MPIRSVPRTVLVVISLAVLTAGQASAADAVMLVGRTATGKERLRVPVAISASNDAPACEGTGLPAAFVWKHDVYLVSLACNGGSTRTLEIAYPSQPSQRAAPVVLMSPCAELPCVWQHSGQAIGLDDLVLSIERDLSAGD